MRNQKQLSDYLGKITTQDRWGYGLLAIILFSALVIGLTSETTFNIRFAGEDGIVENMTAIALFCVAVLCAYRLIRFGKFHQWSWVLGTTIFTLLFFFAGGEEISWGQRIFGWQTNEYFLERNAQQETNIHNLIVGDTKLNKLIFSQLLSVAMGIYLLIFPVLYQRVTWIRNIADRFAVPVVKWHHTVAFLLATLLVLIIPAERKWEVYEMAFGFIFFLIFLNPLNKEVVT